MFKRIKNAFGRRSDRTSSYSNLSNEGTDSEGLSEGIDEHDEGPALDEAIPQTMSQAEADSRYGQMTLEEMQGQGELDDSQSASMSQDFSKPGRVKQVKNTILGEVEKQKRAFGVKMNYSPSSDPAKLPLTSDAAQGRAVRVADSEYSSMRQNATKAANLAAGPFVNAAGAVRKARQVGALKDDIAGLDTDDAVKADLRVMANSLKGSYKRRAGKEMTVGVAQKATGAAITALSGAPGLGELATASVSEAATWAASSAAGFVAGKIEDAGGGKLKEAASNLGGKKLSQDEWQSKISDYVGGSAGPQVQDWTLELMASVHLSNSKANAMKEIAAQNPKAAAESMVAAQKGPKAVKKLEHTRKKHSQAAAKVSGPS